jgi:hypothetical protein
VKIVNVLPIMLLVFVVAVVVRLTMDKRVDYEVSTVGLDIPQFTEIQPQVATVPKQGGVPV